LIYFAQAVCGGPVKIGTAVDVDRRLAQLEANYGQPLALLATMPGGQEEEQAIHERFSEIRLGRTEQFKPTFELMTFIGRPLLVGANPDAVEAMDSHCKPMVAQLRGSAAWKAWIEELADFDDRAVASLFERAVHRYAKEVGFPKEPPER
jgi:hypothetical protein